MYTNLYMRKGGEEFNPVTNVTFSGNTCSGNTAVEGGPVELKGYVNVSIYDVIIRDNIVSTDFLCVWTEKLKKTGC